MPNVSSSPVFSKTLDLIARRGPITVFVRDDDVDRDEDSLRRLVDLFGELDAPLSLAVVPGLLTDTAVEYLRSAQRNAPARLELHQHGWLHQNHEEPGGRAAEFGWSRSFDQQISDIDAGRRRMREFFEDRWYAAFTPPWHASTENTAKALLTLGFEAFSGSVNQVLSLAHVGALCKVPVTLDFEFVATAKAQTAVHLFQQMMDHQFVGLLLHHKIMKAGGFAFLKSWLTPLLRHEGVRFTTLRDLARSGEGFTFACPRARLQPLDA